MARVERYLDDYPPITMIVDSGADFHVVGNRDLLLDMEGCTKKLLTAKGEDLNIIGVGTLSMCLGVYQDKAGERQALDVQFDNVYYAPECAFNILSLKRLNDENIHLDTGSRSLIFPAPRDMQIPEQGKTISFDYKTWSLHQCDDAFGYPAFRVEYTGRTYTLRGWLNNSGEEWEKSNHILALKDHPTNDAAVDIIEEINDMDK